MKQIAIIDVGSGNLYSVEKAVRHVADEETQVFLCEDAEQLKDATHIILPGVGAFADCMEGLTNRKGMREALEAKCLQGDTPFFGICVGMQMLFERGVEHGIYEGLGWVKGEVVSLEQNSEFRVQSSESHRKRVQQDERGQFLDVGEASRPSEPLACGAARHVSDSSRDSGRNLKIPHMGWNELQIKTQHPYLTGVSNGDHAYFVHSYHCVPQEEVTAVTVDYGGEVVAAIAKDNVFATQFHPEKSQKTGLRILQNFLQLPHAR